MLFLLFKAQTLNLFDAPVTVTGHIRGGTYVAPYQATRKKAPVQPPANDLFNTPKPAPAPQPAPAYKLLPFDQDHFVARMGATMGGRWWMVGVRLADDRVAYVGSAGTWPTLGGYHNEGWQAIPAEVAKDCIAASRADRRKASQRYFLGKQLDDINTEGAGNYAKRIQAEVEKRQRLIADADARDAAQRKIRDNPAAYGYQKGEEKDLPVNQVVEDTAGNQYAIFNQTWGLCPGKNAFTWPLKRYEEGGYETCGFPGIWRVCTDIPPDQIMAATEEEQQAYLEGERRADEERRQEEEEQRQAEEEQRQAEEERRQAKDRAAARKLKKEASAPAGALLYRAGILHDKNPQGIFLSDQKKMAEQYIHQICARGPGL